jgi:hypothetical protein
MEARALKKQTAFRLDENLLDKLKVEAKKANRSLSNYVESILMESVFNEPNETTLAAMKEAENGDLETLELDNFKQYIASLTD